MFKRKTHTLVIFVLLLLEGYPKLIFVAIEQNNIFFLLSISLTNMRKIFWQWH
jgi:hypothetical protein